ncbi:MAG: hypothetical protein ACKVRP_12275 [Bacteroidota bacterium]
MEQTDPEVLMALFGLCFELVGGLPDNRSKRIVKIDSHNFRQGRFRTAFYTHDVLQKYKLIMRSALNEEFKRFYSIDDLEDHFKGDIRDFVEWFRQTHPTAYALLF